MYSNNKLSKAVRLALAFGATTAFAGTAIAQEAVDEESSARVERIEVTGSRIKRADLESASPITVFTAEDVAASGHVTIEGFIHSIPSINGFNNGRATNNGSGGSASASMRGLGSARTLLLINGRRYASGDLNSIPMGFIERVEVLRDGASTIYGSDAIAGVINFITKRDFEGAEFIAQYDLTGEGDGETTRVAATIGASSNRSNVVLSLEYSNRNPIWQKDREFSSTPWGESGGQLIPVGSSNTTPGMFTIVGGGSQQYVVDKETGQVRNYNAATDGYNFATTSYMVTPQEVFSINASAHYELTDNISAFLEGGYTSRQSEQLMAADGSFWGARMTADHPDNPVGQDILVSRRFDETGGRRFTQDFSDYRMVFGFQGYLDNGWNWDVSYNYARYLNATLDIGRANTQRFNEMVNPTLCAASPGCSAVGLWNPLVEGNLTPEQIAYGTVPNSPLSLGETKQLQANLSGDTGDLSFDAGSIGWAVGYEKRWEYARSVPDGGAVVGQIYGVGPNPMEGSYAVDELYTEVNVPILAGVAGAERLDFSAAIRWTDYNFLSSQTVTKFGLEYVPVEGLLVRTTWSEGFRAPTIGNLYGPQNESNTGYSDPCREYATSGVSATVQANCASEGLPGDFLPGAQSASVVGGSPNVQPEESESFTVGFVWSPNFINNFSLVVDYYDIEITNGLGTPNITVAARECYESPNFSSAACDLFTGPSNPVINRPGLEGSNWRAFNGVLAGFMATTGNVSSFQTSGIDFDASWSTELADGQLRLRLDGTYMLDYKYQSQAGAAIIDNAGKYNADPMSNRVAAFSKLQANLTASYSWNDFNASWTSRYQSAVDDIAPGATDLSSSVGTYIYHDLQLGYTFTQALTTSFGVRNLFDKVPPYTSWNSDMNTLNSSYDTAGRYFYARLAYRF